MGGCFDCDGNDHGAFVYPQQLDHLQYNFRDTLRAQWHTDYDDGADCDLALWWWTKDPWTKSFNTSVPCNGSENIPLNIATDGHYLAQLNLNHTFPNGSYSLILSSLFDVNHDANADPVTWKNEAAAASATSSVGTLASSDAPKTVTRTVSTSTSSTSARTTSATSARTASATATSTALPSITPAAQSAASTETQVPTTPPVSRSSHDMGAGAIAGAVVGIILAIALLAGLGFYIRRRRQRRQPQSQALGTQGSQQQVAETYLPWRHVETHNDTNHREYYPPQSSEKGMPEKGQRVVEIGISKNDDKAFELDAGTP